MPNPEQPGSFVEWYQRCITGDEKGQAQIFLDRLFQAFGLQDSLDVGGSPEFRVLNSAEDGGGTSFADYVWKPVVLIEMKKRGENLQKQHWIWFVTKCSKLTERFRYTPDSVFDTFPWPQFEDVVGTRSTASPISPSAARRDIVVESPAKNRRSSLGATSSDYVAPDGAKSKSPILAHIRSLNQQVAERIEKGDPVTAPGVPKNYPDAKKLVTEDCVRPN